MLRVKVKSLAFLVLAGVMGSGYSATPATALMSVPKSYQLQDLKTVISNDSSCSAVYKSLEALSAKPLSFQFARATPGTNNFNIADRSGQMQNHTYSIMQQQVTPNSINRVGMGTFTLNKQNISYVVDIAGDMSQKDFKYLYPVIISSDNGHCYFTAIVSPDKTTQASFKSSIQKGSVTTGADLAQ